MYVAVRCGNYEGIVVFVGRLFALDVLLGDADAQADSLALEVDGVT